MLTIKNVENIYLCGKPVTKFYISELRDNSWIFDYSSTVEGHLKTKLGVAKKHCRENGTKFNKENWEF